MKKKQSIADLRFAASNGPAFRAFFRQLGKAWLAGYKAGKGAT